MKKIYYIGDWAIQLGPVYAETPFNYSPKGTEVINYGKWLKHALEEGDYEVNSVPTWEFYELAPGEWEKILSNYDIIIFSDVEAKNFQLAPQFFNHNLFGKEILTFPDRVRLTVEAIASGVHAMFLGGWLSFNGEMGKGGWGRTSLAEVLPVTCLETEDLRESTEGFTAGEWDRDYFAKYSLNIETLPPILGYNRVIPKTKSTILAKWSTGDPMLAIHNFGKGCVLAYTSDPAPHWGCNFVFWEQYKIFWQSLATTLTENAY